MAQRSFTQVRAMFANSTIARWMLRGSLVLGLGVGVIGLAHTPFGRPLLGYMGMLPGCPVSLDNADPVKAEAFRRAQLQARAGDLAPLGRPALGFELGLARRADVQAWIQNQAGSCSETRGGSVVRCEGAKLKGEPDIEDIHFQFDQADRLVAIDLFRKGNCGAQALQHLTQLEKRLSDEVGPATQRSGESNAEYLDAASMRRVGVEFRYSDYLARLSAMNFGTRGVRVRESYQFSGT
jgi:hypothetical protein